MKNLNFDKPIYNKADYKLKIEIQMSVLRADRELAVSAWAISDCLQLRCAT